MTRRADPLPAAPVVAAYAVGAALLASAAPLLAYAGSLALLGAPHALAELRYVDGRFSRRLGTARGLAVAAILAVVVGLRCAVLAGWIAPATAVPAELGLVAVLAFTVVPDLAARPLRALVAVGVGAVIAAGSWAAPTALVVALAVLHNATPIGFLAERDDVRPRLLVPALVAFVAVPALVATGLPSRLLAEFGCFAPDAAFASAGALGDHLRVFVPPAWVATAAAPALFAAAAYLQLMHYGVVLGVLPRLLAADADTTDRPALPWPRRRVLAWTIAVVGAGFAVAFFTCFVPARSAYGLLAAVHAWIEIPVLLLALVPRDALPFPPSAAAPRAA
ncbi:MAG: hypothetical protein K8T90_05700 [Planctomycetes bacterium]|nr:hypothetical protein [Planctomycetota bacterium]